MIVKEADNIKSRSGKISSRLDKASRALAGRRCLVAGLASTGISASRFLKRCGALVTATDMKPEAQISGVNALKDMGVVIEAGGHRDESFEGAEMVVVSPGVPFRHPLLERARGRGAQVISDIELAYMFMDCPVLALSGTNGKSTTTELLGQIVKDAGYNVFIGGNIGTPAIEYVEKGFDGEGGKADFAVLEISSFHLETTRTFNPRIGALLNITEDHLDRYGDFDEYARTKFRLFENQGPSDYAVVNVNDPVIAGYLAKNPGGKGRTVKFTASGELEEGLYIKDGDIIYKMDGQTEAYPSKGFILKGLHNMENIMAAVAMARLSGIPRAAVLKTLSAFRGLRHRMEFVREFGGAVYIDDSKGTNIGALDMALRGLRGGVVLIAGGRDKGGEYRSLAPAVKEKVRLLILMGEARFKMKEALEGLTQTLMAASMEEAVALARERASSGDTVLLCPACSSFDMFRDYKERGDRFRALVEAFV